MNDPQNILIGAWEMLGEEDVDADGRPVHAAVSRSGRVTYTKGGQVAVVSTPAERQPIASAGRRPTLTGATEEDILAAVAGCAAYAGRYEIDGDIVKHHVEVALNPNLIGTTLTRRFELDGERLTFFTTPIGEGAFLRIRWCRAS